MTIQATQTKQIKKRLFSEGPFSKEIQKYEELIDKKTGMKVLQATEKENFYNRIQEQVEDQLLDTIIKRYKVDLNDRHITDMKDEIVDMTQYPDDLLGVYALASQLEKQFKESPAEVKSKFGDFAGYLRAFEKGTLASDLSSVLSKQPVQPAQTAAANQPAQTAALTQSQVNNGVIAGQQSIGGVIYE